MSCMLQLQQIINDHGNIHWLIYLQHIAWFVNTLIMRSRQTSWRGSRWFSSLSSHFYMAISQKVFIGWENRLQFRIQREKIRMHKGIFYLIGFYKITMPGATFCTVLFSAALKKITWSARSLSKQRAWARSVLSDNALKREPRGGLYGFRNALWEKSHCTMGSVMIYPQCISISAIICIVWREILGLFGVKLLLTNDSERYLTPTASLNIDYRLAVRSLLSRQTSHRWTRALSYHYFMHAKMAGVS